jgi:hypothetical protein
MSNFTEALGKRQGFCFAKFPLAIKLTAVIHTLVITAA